MEQSAISPNAPHDSQVSDVAAALLPYIQTSEDGTHQLHLSVEGIHCARCIHAIESALAEEENIEAARVNMSTSRLHIIWNGTAEQAAIFTQKVAALGYAVRPIDESKNSKRSEEDKLLRYVAVAGFGMGNIMLISVALWSSEQMVMGMAMRDLFHWVSALIALPVIAYSGRPFFASAYAMLRQGHTNMDVPISLALLLASGMSIAETMRHGEHAYFDSAVMLLFFLLCGRWLDARARGKARAGAEQLLERMQGTATIQESGDNASTKTIKISDLRAGMKLRIAAGDKIPADAEVTDGVSEIDMSLLNGETMPQTVQAGSNIFAGTINLSAPLTATVSKPSEDSLLAQVVRLMEQAEQGRARYVRLADKAAQLYTPVVHTLSAAAFIGWFFFGAMAWQDALLISITTLIITCPCALGLAVPVVQVLTSGWLMKHGLLLKSGDALERLAAIDTVIFDKTGTLTSSAPQLCEEPENTAFFQLAASLAAQSNHPLSKALSGAYNGELLPLSDIQEIAGHGMQATHKEAKIQLGRRSWCGDENSHESDMPELWLSRDGDPLHVFRFEAPQKDGASELIEYFQARNIEIHLLSGDRAAVVEKLADELNIANYKAGCMPADKTAYIENLHNDGHKVLMLGDGLNDAAALSAAHVSLAPSSGMDITQNSADIILQSERLQPVISAHNMALFSTKLVKQNFALAIMYNCLAIPLAVAGYVTPLIAAIAMSSSSLIVIANSFRINLQKDAP